jgi:hypothetical protein
LLCTPSTQSSTSPQLTVRHERPHWQIAERVGGFELAQQPGSGAQAEIGRFEVFARHQAVKIKGS